MAVSLSDSATHHRTNSATTHTSYNVNNSTVEVQRHLSDIGAKGSSPFKMRKAKRIRFLCNGDRFYKGVVMAVAPERYRSFDSLLTDLTRAFSGNINLPSGVRTVFTMDGNKVLHLDELEDGKLYVCSGNGDQFKKVDYAVSNAKGGVRPARSLPKLNNNSIYNVHGSQNSSIKSKSSLRPRIVILVRNGVRPRRVVRLLLNKRNAPSFEHALSTITDTVKLDTGAVRRVFNSRGIQLYNLEDFFEEDDTFFVYGSERLNGDDFELDFEELKAIQALKKSLRKPVSELKNGTHCFDETGKKVPKLPNTSKQMKNQTGVKKVDNSMQTIPSKVLSRYSIGQVIGDGNFAVVRKCSDKMKNVDYALKIIDKSKVAGKEFMIDNEVTILRSVGHTNIIRLIAEHDTPKELYLIMELVTGGDLFDAITRRVKFNEPDAQIMTRDLASALAYLHDMKILHRDIKPENLLVEMDGDRVQLLKVGDFGLATRVSGPLYTVCGTPTYVAPEILTEVGYGLKIDVWAAGVILYILLCGFPPFVSSTNDQEELFDDILSGQYGFPEPFWNDVTDCAKDLISHMLQPNPDLRFSAEDVLDHPWLENV